MAVKVITSVTILKVVTSIQRLKHIATHRCFLSQINKAKIVYILSVKCWNIARTCKPMFPGSF